MRSRVGATTPSFHPVWYRLYRFHDAECVFVAAAVVTEYPNRKKKKKKNNNNDGIGISWP